jgi:hypothetical protein
MRIHHIAAVIAVAAVFPMAASAQTSCERQQANRIAGTVAGAGIGAVVGSNVAGHGAKSEGGVLGAIAGGIIGNQLAKPKTECAHAYGYYDDQGAWHVNAVDRNVANGYYDRDGRWMSGAPNGYYDVNGSWRTGGDGYYDNDGRWVPPRVNGYYDANDRWIAVSARNAPSQAGQDRFDIRDREDRIRDRIDRGLDRGDLSRREARRFRTSLDGIVSREASLPHYRGQLEANDNARINAELDALNRDIRNHVRD